MTERKAMTPNRKARILLSHEGKCWRCGVAFVHGDKIEYDHIHALARGGTDDDSNIGPCHALCHRLKTHGTAALRLGADIFEIAKTKRLAKKHSSPVGEKPTKPKRKIQSRGFDKTLTRGFDGKTRLRDHD